MSIVDVMVDSQTVSFCYKLTYYHIWSAMHFKEVNQLIMIS